MIKLIENNIMGKAYMLDKDNNLFEVKFHPYGYEGDIEENSSCAYFLYIYDKKNKDKIKSMLFNYIAYCFSESNSNDILELHNNIIIGNNKEFNYLFSNIMQEFDTYNSIAGWSLINKSKVMSDLFNITLDSCKKYNITKITDISEFYNNEDNIEAYLQLNENFTRVRIGGRYDNNNEDCIYFRISSIGCDWGKNIMSLVFNKFMNRISYITIERDLESAKLNNKNHIIYKTKDGQPINHMPIKDFIYQEHIPLVASMKLNSNNLTTNIEMLSLLESGHSMVEMRNYIPKSILLSEYKIAIKEQIKLINS